MSMKIANPSIARVENSFKQLAAAAQALNHASDDLGKVIRHLEGALKKLELEIPVWVQINGTSDETQYWATELGYIKLDGKWCIALREVSGYLQETSDESEDTWAFSNAPRALRAEAVDKIPDLLEKMLQQTEEATQGLKTKTEQAAELTFMVSNLVPSMPVPAPQTWHRPAAGAATDKNEGAQGGNAMAARFRGTNALPTERSVPAPTPNVPPAGSPGRFREVDSAPAERTAAVLPTERVS